MKILKDAVTSLAREGRPTLQIPQHDIWFSKEPPPDKDRFEEIPNEWVITLRNGTPIVGKEEGYLFLTRAGWEANKDKIEKAFGYSGINRRGTWEDFEVHAETHFNLVTEATFKRIKSHVSKIKQLLETVIAEDS